MRRQREIAGSYRIAAAEIEEKLASLVHDDDTLMLPANLSSHIPAHLHGFIRKKGEFDIVPSDRYVIDQILIHSENPELRKAVFNFSNRRTSTRLQCARACVLIEQRALKSLND